MTGTSGEAERDKQGPREAGVPGEVARVDIGDFRRGRERKTEERREAGTVGEVEAHERGVQGRSHAK